MDSKTRVFRCNCEGNVSLKVKNTKKEIIFEVKNCDKCDKSYGIKSLTALKEITQVNG
jgi:hypothetical protein